MATVRLTDDLKKEILSKARELFDEQISSSSKTPKEFDTNAIYEHWLDQTVGLREDIQVGIRRNWLSSVKTLRIKNLNGKHVDLWSVETANPVWVPQSVANFGLDLSGPFASDLFQVWKTWREHYEWVRTKREQFKQQTETLLKRHATLKQALSEWPALWDFLPANVKEKHNEEKARIAKAKKEAQEKPAVDLDVLNGAIVTAKIMKGGLTN